MNKSRDALAMIETMIGDDPAMRTLLEQARVRGDIARLLYDARHSAQLTQRQLAKLAGIDAEVIDDLEAADYDGDVLSIANQIATALKKELAIELLPKKKRAKHTRRAS